MEVQQREKLCSTIGVYLLLLLEVELLTNPSGIGTIFRRRLVPARSFERSRHGGRSKKSLVARTLREILHV